ncbi:hypothetical protein HK098_002049 [Nowakowskiella sp. JEL0407]|nr:hypothetical protein HK098_003576 [Nowakowskiella sp. JEL0407]KAJ3123261.1 hypothetical protein HK098_002049 [Nowakowskiella sp. JEL0407]
MSSCSSFATQTYSTATITRVALVTETNGCYYPLSEAHTYNEIITFQYGSINGIVAATPSPSPSPSPSPPPPQSPIVSTVATVIGNGNVSTSSVNDTSNNLVIIIGVASAIVVIIAVIIGFVVVRRYANKNNNQAAAVPPPIQPIYDPYQTMNSNRPVSMMPSPGVQGAYYVPGSQQSSNYNPLMGGNPNFVNAAYPPPSEPQSAVMLSPVLPPKQ